MKKILSTLALSLFVLSSALFVSNVANAASGWSYVDAKDFSFPYRYGQHVLVAADQNGHWLSVASFEPLVASSSEKTSLFTVRRPYEQKELKDKLEAIGRASKIAGVTKELVENSLSNLYQPGKRYVLLGKDGVVYEAYIPKLKNKTQEYWFDQAVKNLKFTPKAALTITPVTE